MKRIGRPFNFWAAFSIRVVALALLYLIILWILFLLRRQGDVAQTDDEKPVSLSRWIGAIEQVIFYFAAIAGVQVFGFGATSWFVLKAVSSYGLWEAQKESNGAHWARAHNRRQIFMIGTLMSVAAGGLAGFVYHLVLHCLELKCGS